jgi:hypothetical protein
MSGFTGAALIGTAAAGIGAAVISSNAASSAADKQAQGLREQLAFQERENRRAEELLRPFRGIQLEAATRLRGLAEAGNPEEMAEREYITKAIQRKLAAQGLLRSSKQGAGLAELEVGLAQRRANILQALSGAGGGAVGQAAAQISSGGAAGGQVLGQIGSTLGAGTIAGNPATGINNAVQGALGNYYQLQLLQKLGGGGAGGGVGAGNWAGLGVNPAYGGIA